MAIDGGLRPTFRKHLAAFHWTSIETGSTGRGIPDSHFAANGVTGWIEFKLTDAWAVSFKPEQIAWSEAYVRHGGRYFVAVRRKASAGPRRGAAVDDLFLYGSKARALSNGGLGATGKPLGIWPARGWNWPEIGGILLTYHEDVK